MRNVELARHVPFGMQLCESGFTGGGEPKASILSFVQRPEIILRTGIGPIGEQVETGEHYPNGKQPFIKSHPIIARQVSLYRQAQKHFQLLEDKYAIPVVHQELVIGDTAAPTHVTFYTVTQRVFGENVSRTRFTADHTKMLDTFFSSLAMYFIDVFNFGTPYLSDIAKDNSQFVYGKRSGDKKPRIYLVDIDPTVSEFDPHGPNYIRYELGSILGMMVNISEKGLYKGFTNTIRILKNFLTVIPSDSTQHAAASSLLERLNHI